MNFSIFKDEEAWQGMRKAGALAAQTLDHISDFVKPGVTTNYLNDICHKFIIEAGAIPAPLNYRGFPKSICTSKNRVVCHGIPDDTALKKGDILNIDVTVILDGWYGDTSRMFYLGVISDKDRSLCRASYDIMMSAINYVKPGMCIYDIGCFIEQYMKQKYSKYSSVRNYCGHGIGRQFHTQPSILHYKEPIYGKDIYVEEGMFFTIEPMINAGSYETFLSAKDNWTVFTKDMLNSAQFEHTIGINSSGAEIMTLSHKDPNLNYL
ncbi:type I methionyl aminopeptidase [Anaplasmataceae bacterium AB001_6]|nr:type I methionyl aminopeptidase [Anaplasmataceae bacterium AB001_6]